MNPGENTSIVLVTPTHPGNIGAAARAMKNMGFRFLRIVEGPGSARHLCPEARRMASGAEEILETARLFPSLAEALADFQVTVGTTARRSKGRRPVLDPRSLRDRLAQRAPGTRVGVVFGREDRGLTNEELDLCHWVVTIPTAPEHTSLNLAQAVLLLCYELREGRVEGAPPDAGLDRSGDLATSAELEGLYRHAREVLLRVGFLHPENPDRILRVLRRVLGRAGMDSREVSIFRGILRQMDWYASGRKGRSGR